MPTFEDMVVGDLFVPGTREWDIEVINEAFNGEDRASIMRTTPAPPGNVDKQVWHYSSSGLYTMKTGYHLAARLVDGVQGYNETPWKGIWRVKVPPKVRAFYWRLCKGCLAVRTKIRRWYPTTETTCPLCLQMPKSFWHLFVDCAFAKSCWEESQLWQKIDSLCYEVDGHSDLFLNLPRQLENCEMERAAIVVWAIWRARNEVVWNDRRSSPCQAMFSATIFLAEWGVVEAARWAVNLGFTHVMVESDSKRVVDALKTSMDGGTVLCDYIAEGRSLFASQEHFSISWVCRSANLIAHTIARTSRLFDNPYC